MTSICQRCGNQAHRKDPLLKHLRRKYPCAPLDSNVAINELLQDALVRDRNAFNEKSQTYDCKFCGKK
jgi:hypothetical protein